MHIEADMSASQPTLVKAQPPKEMISVRSEGAKRIVKINSSSLGTIQECMRKAKYSLYEGWRGETEPPATVYGSAIHKALEVFYLGNPAERKLPALDDMERMSYGHKILGEDSDLLLRATRAFIDRAHPLASLPPEDRRSLQTGVWLLHNYFSIYLNDPYVAYVDEQGPFVERGFTFRLFDSADLAIDCFGTIDLVVQNSQTGAILVCDHKTTSMLGENFFSRLKPNHQYTCYLMGAQRVFGLKTSEFVVNAIETKVKPKTARGSGPSFPRQVTTRDEGDFAEFTEAMTDAARRYLAAIDSDVWPMGHVNACSMYSGCSYQSVCSVPAPMRQNVLDVKFKRETT